MSNGQAKYWFATWNMEEFSDEDFAYNTFLDMGERPGVRGILGQLECGESGNFHLQFAVYLERGQRGTWLSKNICESVHWERCESVSATRTYVTKPESRIAGPWQLGDFPELGNGRRSDLEALQADLDSGTPLREISEAHFGAYLRYARGIQSYLLLRQTPRDWEMEVRVLWGAAGAGKTRAVYERGAAESKSIYTLAQNYNGGVVWWDAYEGQDIVLIDDFYGWLPFSYLLRLLDRYQMLVRNKDGHIQFSSKIIYITSNHSPDTWYKSISEEQLRALRRRFTSVVHYETPFQ